MLGIGDELAIPEFLIIRGRLYMVEEMPTSESAVLISTPYVTINIMRLRALRLVSDSS